MDETNCLGIHCFAEVHACTELMHRAKAFLLQHFQVKLFILLRELYLSFII